MSMRIPEQKREKILAAINRGITYSKIAAQFGVSIAAIYGITIKEGIRRRPITTKYLHINPYSKRITYFNIKPIFTRCL